MMTRILWSLLAWFSGFTGQTSTPYIEDDDDDVNTVYDNVNALMDYLNTVNIEVKTVIADMNTVNNEVNKEANNNLNNDLNTMNIVKEKMMRLL